MKYWMIMMVLAVCPTFCFGQFLSEKEQRILKSYIPENEVLNDLKPIVKFYHLEKVYQNGGLHSVYYNISATKPIEPFGNANLEFPWNVTAGLENTNPDLVKSYKFVFLPKEKPIQFWRNQNLRDQPYQWQYPSGTVFGEILTLKESGNEYTFEVRTRTRGSKSWAVQVYRPFKDYEEYKEAVLSFKDDERRLLRRNIRNGHNVKIINRDYLEETLPSLPKETVRKLLNRPFKPAGVWATGSETNDACYSPTSKDDFNIVPKGYNGAFLKVDNKSCMECHNTCGNIHTFELQSPRDWYGYVRGSDGIFSFHIFDPRYVSYNGFPVEPVLNKELYLESK